MDKNKKILVASMGRTGSHLLLYILQEHFSNVKHCHYFDENLLEWADVIVSTKRDMREQMASTQRFLKAHNVGFYTQKEDGTHNTLIEECEMAMKIYRDWEPYVEQFFILEDWFTKPEEYLKSVLDLFEISYDDNKIKKMVSTYSKPVVKKHITKTSDLINYKKTLTEEEVGDISELFNTKYKEIKENFLYIENYFKKQ